jgi:integral membrane sensor domain MASE1
MLGGFLCFLLGLGAIFIEFIAWGKSHFASLQTISEIKLIGLSILLVSVGAQSIFFGVFQGLLGVYTEIKETDLPN